MLREERRARVEEVALPLPRPSWRQRLDDWANGAPPRPTTALIYEFSVGKYRYAGAVADRWEFVRIPAEEFERAAETQKVTPLLLMRNAYGKRWWWYLDRFYQDGLGLTPGEVHEQVLRLRKAEAEERARLLGVTGAAEPRPAAPPGETSRAPAPARPEPELVRVRVEELEIRANAA